MSGLLSSFLQPYFGKLADRFSKEKMIVIGNIVDPIGLILTAFMQNFYQLFALYLVIGIGRAICIPASSAFAATEGKKFGMGSSIGIFSMAMSVGMFGGPLLGGLIMDWGGLSSAFYFGSAMEFLGTGLFIWFLRDKIRKNG
jgi:MFS family permease